MSKWTPSTSSKSTASHSDTDPDGNTTRSYLVIRVPRCPERKRRVNRRHAAFRQPFQPTCNAPRLSPLGYSCRNSAVSASPHPSGTSFESSRHRSHEQASQKLCLVAKIDQDIEKTVHECIACQLQQKQPTTAALHPWEWPARPSQRVHVDFAGPSSDR